VVLILEDAAAPAPADSRLDRLPGGLRRLTVRNKIDLTGEAPGRKEDARGVTLALSARSGDGVELLHDELLAIAGWQPAEDVFIARERHLRALATAAEHCDAAAASLAAPRPALELFAEDLRLAQKALGEITGETTAEAARASQQGHRFAASQPIKLQVQGLIALALGNGGLRHVRCS
jgi:tRNA modification GTPase